MIALALGCSKPPCLTTVKTTIPCADVDKVLFVYLHFQQGDKIVLTDALNATDFKNGVYYKEYEFPDTNPDLLVWKVYAIDRSWVEYKTVIK